MVPQERFELPTLALQKPCTTAVLLWHGIGLTGRNFPAEQRQP